MPKVSRILPPTSDALPPKPAPAIELPEFEEEPPAPAQAGPEQATPEEMRPLTILILGIICKVAKGDEPTDHEVNLVNPPMCAVANKYNLSNRWTAELALFGSVLIVVQSSRRRAAEKQPETPMPRDRADIPIHNFTMQEEVT